MLNIVRYINVCVGQLIDPGKVRRYLNMQLIFKVQRWAGVSPTLVALLRAFSYRRRSDIVDCSEVESVTWGLSIGLLRLKVVDNKVLGCLRNDSWLSLLLRSLAREILFEVRDGVLDEFDFVLNVLLSVCEGVDVFSLWVSCVRRI